MKKENKTWPISIWIGVEDENFYEYMNQDKYGEECGFCKDIGSTYDVDTVCIYREKEIVPVGELVNEIPFSECFEKEFIDKCYLMGLMEVKTFISILDEEFDFPSGKNFSGLRFVGVFEYSLPDSMLNWYGKEE
ncbi:hypothetical protein YV76_004647 [Salmonella enterica subsp. enterica]|nr:hypothetical protein [Salmonella enterica subsp. enterica]